MNEPLTRQEAIERATLGVEFSHPVTRDYYNAIRAERPELPPWEEAVAAELPHLASDEAYREYLRQSM